MKNPAKLFATCVAVSLLTWGAPVIAGDTGDFRAANGVCSALMGTKGIVPACAVKKGKPSSISLTIDTKSLDAGLLCKDFAAALNEDTSAFLVAKTGWELRVVSPYSNGQSIAVCSLNKNNSQGLNK